MRSPAPMPAVFALARAMPATVVQLNHPRSA